MPPKGRRHDDESTHSGGFPVESDAQVGLAASCVAPQAVSASRSPREGVVPESPPHATPMEPVEALAAQLFSRFDVFSEYIMMNTWKA